MRESFLNVDRTMEDGGEAKRRPCVAPSGLFNRWIFTQGDARGLACRGLRYSGPSGLKKTRGRRLNACMHNQDPREDGWKAVSALAKATARRAGRCHVEHWFPPALRRSVLDFKCVLRFRLRVQLKYWRYELKLAHTWTIASGVNTGGTNTFAVAIIQLTADDGTVGLGETAPSSRYKETVAGGLDFFAKVDARKLSFDNVEASMKYVEGLMPGQFAAKSAINIALLDGSRLI